MTERILHLAMNTIGRDFLLGDIHACFDEVWEAMKKAKFNPHTDRLFSTGDLIDRGKDSHRCVRFIALPYVFPAKGNHEDLVEELYRDGEPHPAALEYTMRRNGFGWWRDTSPEQRKEILTAIATLPLVIEIETTRGTAGIIHGDVPAGMDWATFKRKISEGDAKTIKTCLWGRDRLESGDESGVPGIGRLFVGHTPQWDGIRRFGNVYAIDTGCVFGVNGKESGGRLTMAEATMQTTMLTARRDPILVDLRADTDHTLTPFGVYC